MATLGEEEKWAELGKQGNFERDNFRKKLISYQNIKITLWEKVSRMMAQYFSKILLHLCVLSETGR